MELKYVESGSKVPMVDAYLKLVSLQYISLKQFDIVGREAVT